MEMRVSGEFSARAPFPQGSAPLPYTYFIGGLVNLTLVLDAVERQKPLPLPGIEPRFVDHRNL
jgi:hypothetical protein